MISLLPPPAAGERKHDFFHPAIAPLNDGRWLMTVQRYENSDCYGAPEYLLSDDEGGHWSAPAPIQALYTQSLDHGLRLGIADVRPFAAPDGRHVVAIGCDTVYTPRGCAAWDKDAPAAHVESRGSFYSVFDVEKQSWGPRRMLRDPRLAPDKLWRIACAQVAFTPNGDWLLPVYFEYGKPIIHEGFQSPRFAVRTVRARLVGDELQIQEWGRVLYFENARGFIEPSVVRHGRSYYLTIRAEDGAGYVTSCADGLNWQDPAAWHFDNGTRLATDSTQQHWLPIGEKLLLIYTRDNGENASIMRFRAPLFAAEVELNGETPVLKKATETVVLPRRIHAGQDGLLGNFHACALSDGSGLVSDSYGYLTVENDDVVEHYTEVAIARVRA